MFLQVLEKSKALACGVPAYSLRGTTLTLQAPPFTLLTPSRSSPSFFQYGPCMATGPMKLVLCLFPTLLLPDSTVAGTD
jgi:hypothetical protein